MTKKQFKKHFPKWLKEQREAIGWPQSVMADKLEISQAWMSHFECGRRLPDAYMLYKMHYLIGEMP